MQAEVKDAFWAIFDTEDLTTPPGPDLVAIIDARIDAFADKYRGLYPAAVKCLLTDREGLTAYLRFPAEHHNRTRHSNFIERTFGETRRRVKVIGRLPGETSCLTLVWAVLDRASAGWRGFTMTADGLRLLQDLHPHDRGPRGTFHGAIITNGHLYCPATPRPLLQLGPLPPAASPDATAAHDTQAAELARHKLGRLTADDTDGYHRVTCPAAMGKLRCPLHPGSMTLDRNRPEILTPPEHPPAC